jgi:hypothetical protein
MPDSSTTSRTSTRPRPGGGRRDRVHRIRRRVVTWTVVAFVALWAAVYVQMRAGADPVLGSAASTALVSNKTSTGASSPTSTSTSTSATGTATSTTGATASSSGTSASPAAVATSQS